MRRLVGAAVAVLAGLLGGAVALLALLVHRLDSWGLPWGLVLGVLASAAACWAVRDLGARPAAVLGYGTGWCALALAAVAGRPEGDFLLAGDAIGWTFLGAAGGAVLVGTAFGVATAAPGERRRRP